MLRIKRRTILFIVVILVVALAAVLALVLSEGRPMAVAADGRTVEIEKITFGTQHRLAHGKWRVRLFEPILGKGWAARRNSYVTQITNETPALMVWTRWENFDRSNRVPVVAAILDERGTESELVLNRWNAVPRSLGSNLQPAYVAWLFNNFPRRAETLRLRIYEHDERYMATQVVELAFLNPVRDPFPEWRGSELPAQVATNGTVFILSSVQQVSNALWRFTFNAQTNGKVDPAWRVRSVTAASVNGNHFSTHSNLAVTIPTPGSQLPPLDFHARHALWPDDPVWRFTADFYRTTDFQSNEIWTLTNIVIPARGVFQFTTNLPSYGYQPLTLKLMNRRRHMPSPAIEPGADLVVIFEAVAHVFLVGATDEQGRAVKTEIQAGAPPHIYSFMLAIPGGSGSINLTFALREPTTVTFGVAGRSLARTDSR